MSLAPTGYHLQVVEIMKELVDHGYGEFTFKVNSGFKDDKTRVDILSGKNYIFFVKRGIIGKGEVI